ncbi:hypothetical protein B0H13DRAFT_2323135 [Mycena leptocephala]|nr:hypothetical protein B0H13DRAFT_2323135 [Mycena leptocephala]
MPELPTFGDGPPLLPRDPLIPLLAPATQLRKPGIALSRNADAEKEKARIRMRSLRERWKRDLEECNSRGETYMEFMTRECEELRATPEFQDFRDFCNKVKAVRLCVDFKNPDEVAELDVFLRSNPSVEDLPAYDDNHVEFLYRRQEWYLEWREELEDYRAIIAENTAENLDKLQVEAQAKLSSRCIILARGGF